MLKKIVFLISILLFASISPARASGQTDLMVIDLSIPINATDKSFQLNLRNFMGTINWGVGSSVGYLLTNGPIIHTYSNPGNYRITIDGQALKFISTCDGTPGSDFVTGIPQWGTKMLASLNDIRGGFAGYPNLSVVPADLPPGATNLDYLFCGSTLFNQSVANWSTSNITSLVGTFYLATSFNQTLNSWNTSNVTNFSRMFWGASSFNGLINGFDTSRAVNMSKMFYGASNFNQDIHQWNTSSLSDVTDMFKNSALDQDLSNWNLSQVTLANGMFGGSSSLSKENYDKLLISLASQNLSSGVNFEAKAQFTSSSASARQTILTKGWSISDGGMFIPTSPTNNSVSNVTAVTQQIPNEVELLLSNKKQLDKKHLKIAIQEKLKLRFGPKDKFKYEVSSSSKNFCSITSTKIKLKRNSGSCEFYLTHFVNKNNKEKYRVQIRVN